MFHVLQNPSKMFHVLQFGNVVATIATGEGIVQVQTNVKRFYLLFAQLPLVFGSGDKLYNFSVKSEDVASLNLPKYLTLEESV